MKTSKGRRVRYVVIGQGYFAQSAVLPAFAGAPSAKLTALVSDDPIKLAELGDRYGVEHRVHYAELEDFLAGGHVDAAYIVLPNHLHREYTEKCAAAGVHVLCEKPMALSESACAAMIHACAASDVKLMIGYRLHFEAGNLRAIEALRDEVIGEARVISSLFTMQVQEGNIRLSAERGGGPLNDIGIYCVNAARYLFGDEPIEVLATRLSGDDPRFAEVDEAISAILRFPDGKVAQFTASFGASDLARYTVVGTRGTLDVENAYEIGTPITHILDVDGRKRRKRFARRDQVAAELIYFSRCILEGTDPEPDGWEGLADVRILDAIRESAATGQAVKILPIVREERPDLAQDIHARAHGKSELVHAAPPSEG